jgi:hypothetical protein
LDTFHYSFLICAWSPIAMFVSACYACSYVQMVSSTSHVSKILNFAIITSRKLTKMWPFHLQLHANWSHLWLNLGVFVITTPNFNYFGHSHNYDATIENFILLVGWILDLFSSINTLICPISRILNVFYSNIRAYLYICIKIIYIYVGVCVCVCTLFIQWISKLIFEICYSNLKIDIGIDI